MQMVEQIVNTAPVFLLIAARCAGLIFTLPLFSMRTVSRVAKIALIGYMAYLMLGFTDFSSYSKWINSEGSFTLEYVLLLIGEAFIGIIIGFYVSIIFAAFSTAAQFFAFQMGFSASAVYDSLNQVENPLLGQFFNFAAVLIFLQNHWCQKIFLTGLKQTFISLNVLDLVSGREKIVKFLLQGLSSLFADAFVIALPIMGTLVLITVCTGLLSKAAPQMNLLSEGFPVMILLSFLLIVMIFEPLCEFFERSFNTGLNDLFSILSLLRTGGK